MRENVNKLKISLAAIYSALKNKETPLWIKLAVIATVIYILSPVDLVPDIPILGYIDDITLLSVMIAVLNKGIPKDIWRKAKDEVRSRMDQTVADAEKYAEENVIDYDDFKESK